jgi:hypothetical protein
MKKILSLIFHRRGDLHNRLLDLGFELKCIDITSIVPVNTIGPRL